MFTSLHGWALTQENFMPYFASKGFDVYALSLRCQGKSVSLGKYIALIFRLSFVGMCV
jgi:hypothetical protein